MYGWIVDKPHSTYSNCKAAILLGNPVTRHVISHGLRLFLEVRTAPPVLSPLCCLSLLVGFGVLPTYTDWWRTVERRR
jgi:hypothetical protein